MGLDINPSQVLTLKTDLSEGKIWAVMHTLRKQNGWNGKQLLLFVKILPYIWNDKRNDPTKGGNTHQYESSHVSVAGTSVWNACHIDYTEMVFHLKIISYPQISYWIKHSS